MSIKVRWYNDDQTIIQYEFVGEWGWEEFEARYEDTLCLLDSVNHKVDFILDFQRNESFPEGFLDRLIEAAEYNHSNMGIALYVGVPEVMRAIGEMLDMLYPHLVETYPFEFAETVAEAEATLTRHRSEWA
jgi:hypothetical protein